MSCDAVVAEKKDRRRSDQPPFWRFINTNAGVWLIGGLFVLGGGFYKTQVLSEERWAEQKEVNKSQKDINQELAKAIREATEQRRNTADMFAATATSAQTAATLAARAASEVKDRAKEQTAVIKDIRDMMADIKKAGGS